jgi:hypothetical protein
MNPDNHLGHSRFDDLLIPKFDVQHQTVEHE